MTATSPSTAPARPYAGLPVVAVASPSTNLKVTWPEDLALAEGLLSRR